jgi:hypothetical protein
MTQKSLQRRSFATEEANAANLGGEEQELLLTAEMLLWSNNGNQI